MKVLSIAIEQQVIFCLRFSVIWRNILTYSTFFFSSIKTAKTCFVLLVLLIRIFFSKGRKNSNNYQGQFLFEYKKSSNSLDNFHDMTSMTSFTKNHFPFSRFPVLCLNTKSYTFLSHVYWPHIQDENVARDAWLSKMKQ